jgi:small subunit ribosomal protein S21
MTTQIIVGENEGLESALKRFKRKCQKDGIITDLRKKVEYVKPSVAKKVKSQNARKRAKKEARGDRSDRPSFSPSSSAPSGPQ